VEQAVALHVIISGRVQGVYFRASAAAEARRLGCTGFAKNLPTGEVEVYAEGSKESLESFLDYLRHGPEGAIVRDMKVTWSSATGEYRDFAVK